MTLRRLGNLDIARSLVTDTYERSAATLGRQHPETAACETELACICAAEQQSNHANEHAMAALTVYRATYGNDHPMTQVAANTLGVILISAGNPAGARTVLEGCLRHLNRQLDERHPYVLVVQLNLATALGDVDRVSRLDQHVHTLLADRYGPNYPLTKTAATSVAHGPGNKARLAIDLEPLALQRLDLDQRRPT